MKRKRQHPPSLLLTCLIAAAALLIAALAMTTRPAPNEPQLDDLRDEVISQLRTDVLHLNRLLAEYEQRIIEESQRLDALANLLAREHRVNRETMRQLFPRG